MILPWKPSDPCRWAELNLADPTPDGSLPRDATVADALAWGLVLPGAADPIEGIVDGCRLELAALADVINERRLADVLLLLSRRLEAAMLLLRWVDNRSKMPTEPAEPPEDLEETREAMLPPEPGKGEP